MHVVVALGIANAGKSTVLSALGDQEELFETGDVPGVTTGVFEKPVGSLLLVDTPGLDVDESHAQIALDRARRSDTVMFCHSLRMGELRPTELDALGRHLRQRERRRTCFVLTHADDVADEDVIRNVSALIAQQLEDNFDLLYVPFGEDSAASSTTRNRRPFNVVAVPRYWAGRTLTGRARSHRMEASGIPHLRRFLADLADRQSASTRSTLASLRKGP